MPFAWGDAAAGAQGAVRQQRQDDLDVEQQLADVAYRQQMMQAQAQQQAQAAQRMQLEREQFDFNKGRQTTQDQRNIKLDERADATYQRGENERGVRDMVGALIRTQGITPQNRDQIIGTLVESGRNPTAEDLRGPDAAADEPLVQVDEGGRPVFRPRSQAAGETAYHPPVREPQGPQLDYEWVTRGGKPMQIRKGTAQLGDEPYAKPSAAAQGGIAPEEAVETAKEIKRIASALRQSKGLGGTFGVISSRLPTVRQDTADAEVLLNSLRSLMTLENTGKLKGVLSNADMELLRQASTTLAAPMGDSAAAAELDRIIGVTGKVGSSPQGGGNQGGPQVGETKTFPNGRVGKWDGQGWVPQ